MKCYTCNGEIKDSDYVCHDLKTHKVYYHFSCYPFKTLGDKQRLKVTLNCANDRIISASREAYQGGMDLLICNLICLEGDLRHRGYDIKTLDEIKKFIERFK